MEQPAEEFIKACKCLPCTSSVRRWGGYGRRGKLGEVHFGACEMIVPTYY